VKPSGLEDSARPTVLTGRASPATGVEFRPAAGNRVTARLAADPATAADLPDD
jgi:hypothetical protein